MYKFIDTTESQDNTELPSEALCINGIYIENEIEGYRTLSVEGRELLNLKLAIFRLGIRMADAISRRGMNLGQFK